MHNNKKAKSLKHNFVGQVSAVDFVSANAQQPNDGSHIFTTSTPKGDVNSSNEFKFLHHLDSVASGLGVGVVLKRKRLQFDNTNLKLPVQSSKLDSDRRLIFVLSIILLALVFDTKMVILAKSYVNQTRIHELGQYAQSKLNDVFAWSNERDWLATLSPVLWGLAMAIFSYTLVYLDSSVPGVNPPSPFSPKSKQIYQQQRRSAMHLGYITALASGFVVTFLLYAKF